MNFVNEEEIANLFSGRLLKQERNLLYLLKLFKLNNINLYKEFLLLLNDEEIEYIEQLIEKREAINLVISDELNIINNIIISKIYEFLTKRNYELLKQMRLILWESE